MRKLESISMKIIEILCAVIVWYILIIAGAVSVAFMYVIPKFGYIALLAAIGMVAMVEINKYLKHKREK